MTAVDVDALDAARAAAWKTAVTVRPHYPPCDFPDHACACGAAEDRPKIVEALIAEVRRGRARDEALKKLIAAAPVVWNVNYPINAVPVSDLLSLDALAAALRASNGAGTTT